MRDSKFFLKKYWKYDSFRPLQKEIIESFHSGKDTIALLPSGGGKSICYQISALLKEGQTLVISPLISLMQDQVYRLRSKGIKAILLVGSSIDNSLETQLDNAKYGNYKLIYCSPELTLNKFFLNRIINFPINQIAIDEAHCISQWGHDFRPAFRQIKNLRALFNNVPMIALTGSATPKVLNDISIDLGLKSPKIFKTSFNRMNINYRVIYTNKKIQFIKNDLLYQKNSCIVFCNSRNDVEKLSKKLSNIGISVDYFHGGLNNKEKKIKLAKCHLSLYKL